MKSTTLLALGTIFVLQSSYAKRPKPPVRAFDAPGAPTFIRLDNKVQVNPPVDAVGNYLIGPVYKAAPERNDVKNVPYGKVTQFNIDSKTTKLLNPGIARK
ncbi:MAG: esterase family protein, partial [Verrucomicrobiaceae bacterium]